MARDYAKEKFYQATLTLATGEGSIKERLESAAVGLSVVRIDHDLPDDILKDYKELLGQLTARPAEIEGEGKIHATIRQMDSYDASKLAERIFELYFRVLGTEPL